MNAPIDNVCYILVLALLAATVLAWFVLGVKVLVEKIVRRVRR